MVYKGKVKNGVIVLEKTGELPEGIEVEVVVSETGNDGPTVLDRLGGVVGIAEGLPSDLARNHDHYIHRRPRQ